MKFFVTFILLFFNNQVEITHSQLADKHIYQFRSSKCYENRQSQQLIPPPPPPLPAPRPRLIKQRKQTSFQTFGLYSVLWRRRYLLPAGRYIVQFCFVSFSLQTINSFSAMKTAIFKATLYVREAIIVKGMQH